jgi:hypothetical protein
VEVRLIANSVKQVGQLLDLYIYIFFGGGGGGGGKIYLLTAIGLTPGGSSTEHIYTKTIHFGLREIRIRFLEPEEVFIFASVSVSSLKLNPSLTSGR